TSASPASPRGTPAPRARSCVSIFRRTVFARSPARSDRGPAARPSTTPLTSRQRLSIPGIPVRLSVGGERTMATNTVRLHRVLRATPEKVYRAFLDPDAMVKWLPPHGFTGKVHHLDAKGGGTYKMSFTNFATGQSHAFGGTYLELVPHERIRDTDSFD